MKKIAFPTLLIILSLIMTAGVFAYTPGINILTGDERPLSFDEYAAVPSFIENAILCDSPFDGEEGKAIVHYVQNPASDYAATGIKINPALDPERAYQVSFRIYQKADEGFGKHQNLWIMKNGMAGWQKAANIGGLLPNLASGWTTHSHLIDNFSSLVHSTTGEVDKSVVSKILFEWRYDSAEATYKNQKIYFDDISIIPAYYVTYKDEDGSIIRSSYEALSGEKYAPALSSSDEEKGIIGWSLSDDGTADETIPLSGKDFTLYAIYDNTLYFNLSVSENLLCEKGEVAEISCNLQKRGGTDGISVSYTTEDTDVITLTDSKNGKAYAKSIGVGLAKIVCVSSTGESDEIYILSDYKEGKSTMKIVKSVSEITTDAQSEEVKAVLFSKQEGTRIKWKSSSDCVTVSSSENGIAVISPVKNGKSTITAFAENDESVCDSFTLTVSGQREKEKVYDINLLVWGASLAKHPPAENLYWYGNWGMAASKEENDFIHRLVYYLEEEYYPSKVNLRILAESGFDTSINNDTSSSTDYSENRYFLNMQNAIEEHNPNIIVTIRTGNLSNDVPVDIAYNAYSQLYDMVFEKVPSAIVVSHHCLLHHDSMKEELYARLDERYKGRIFEAHDLDVHSDESNLAREWLALGQQAVANHWNDKGHDEVAKTTMSYLVKHIPYVLTPSFVYRPESLEISGKNAITEENAAIQLYVSAEPENSSVSVTWHSSDERIATVSRNGLVSAVNNGKVTISAVSTFDEDVYAQIEVTVSGMPMAYTLTYSKNTADTVSGMPENDEFARGNYTLSDKIPERECYTFLGWGLTPNAENTVTELEVSQNTTVYAIWKKTDAFEFEGTYTEDKGFSYGFDIDGGFHVEVKDSCLFTVCTSGEKVRFNSPKLNITTASTLSFSLSSGYFDENSTAELKVKSEGGEKTYVFPILNSGFVTYVADISELDGNVSGFEIYVNSAPADSSMFNIALDFVRFERQLKYKKGTDIIITDGKSLVSNIGKDGYYAISADGKDAQFTLDGGYSATLCDACEIFVNISEENGYVGISLLDTKASGKYGAADVQFFTKKQGEIVKDASLSDMLSVSDKRSIRTQDPFGLRVKAKASKVLPENADVEEYGFVISRKDSVTKGEISDALLCEKYISQKKVVYGKAFSREENIHKVFESADLYEVFSVVLINVPKTQEALSTDLIFKPYIKLSGGRILYGASVETSVLDAAVSLYFSSATDETTKTAAKEIIDICGYGKNDIFLPLDDLWS